MSKGVMKTPEPACLYCNRSHLSWLPPSKTVFITYLVDAIRQGLRYLLLLISSSIAFGETLSDDSCYTKSDLMIDVRHSLRTSRTSFITWSTPSLHNKHRRPARSHNTPTAMDIHHHLLPMTLAKEKRLWPNRSTSQIAINRLVRLHRRVMNLPCQRHRR